MTTVPSLKSSRAVRFGTDNTGSTPAKVSPKSPHAAAVAKLRGQAAALTSPTHQQFVIEHGEKILNLFAKMKRLDKILDTFDDPDYVPRSARISFELKASGAVTETEAFKQAVTETNEIIDDFQKLLTKKIRIVAQLERDTAIHFCAIQIIRTVSIWAKATLILKGQPDTSGNAILPYINKALSHTTMRKYIDNLNDVNVHATIGEVIGSYDMQRQRTSSDAVTIFADNVATTSALP
jgi:hypothetical protein